MDDKTFLKTWEQQVEYRKVKAMARDMNLKYGPNSSTLEIYNPSTGESAQEIIDSC